MAVMFVRFFVTEFFPSSSSLFALLNRYFHCISIAVLDLSKKKSMKWKMTCIYFVQSIAAFDSSQPLPTPLPTPLASEKPSTNPVTPPQSSEPGPHSLPSVSGTHYEGLGDVMCMSCARGNVRDYKVMTSFMHLWFRVQTLLGICNEGVSDSINYMKNSVSSKRLCIAPRVWVHKTCTFGQNSK